MMIITVNPKNPQARLIRKIVEVLQGGGVIGYPTYTFILKATKWVPKIAMTKQNTVGIRIPDNRICLALVKELGHPIISTSVNKPDEGLYNDPAEIEDRFGKQR